MFVLILHVELLPKCINLSAFYVLHIPLIRWKISKLLGQKKWQFFPRPSATWKFSWSTNNLQKLFEIVGCNFLRCKVVQPVTCNWCFKWICFLHHQHRWMQQDPLKRQYTSIRQQGAKLQKLATFTVFAMRISNIIISDYSWRKSAQKIRHEARRLKSTESSWAESCKRWSKVTLRKPPQIYN